jgi:lysyl-tRNA synthetase class 2
MTAGVPAPWGQVLGEQRRRVRVRSWASRVLFVVALLTLVGELRPKPWRAVSDFYAAMWPAGREVTRASLLLTAILLLVAARGLRRGHRLAWVSTLVLLGLVALLHLAHPRGVPLAVLVGAGAVWLATQRRAFPVLPSRAELVRGAAIALVGLTTIGGIVGLLALLAGPTPEDRAQVRAAMRLVSTVLAAVFVVVLAWSLTSPRRPRLGAGRAAHLADRERARAAVRRHGGGTLDYFALRDDKEWFFVADTVVAYAVRGGVCLVSPDPIGPSEQRAQAWAEFRDHAAAAGWSLAVLGADTAWLPVYEASGLRAVYLGDEAIVDCPSFTLAGREHKSLRQTVNRVVAYGYATTFHAPDEVAGDVRAQIEEIAAESRRGTGERGFSMTLSRLFDPHDTDLLLSITRTRDGRVDAFCQWTPAPAIGGWSLDLMRRRLDVPDLPNGLMDFTVVRTIEEVARRGGRGLGLNFAVMRRTLEGGRDSRWDQLVRPVLRRLSEQTQMSSLATYDEKFDPAWLPRYVVLDAAEFVAAQALVMAGAEGVTELPVIGRFLGDRT